MLIRSSVIGWIVMLVLFALMPIRLKGELYFDENGDESPDGVPASRIMGDIGNFGEFSPLIYGEISRYNSKFIDSFRDRYKPYISWELEKIFRQKYFLTSYEAFNAHAESNLRYLKKCPFQPEPFLNILFRIASEYKTNGFLHNFYDDQEHDIIIEMFSKIGEPGKDYLKKLAKTPEELNFTKAKFKDTGMIPWLSEALGKGKTRQNAIFYLGEFGKNAEAYVPKIKRFYDDDDIAIKFGAMEAVLKISPGDEETIKTVKDLSSERTVHPQILKCLSLIPEPQSLTIILAQWRQADDQNFGYGQIASRCADSLGEKVVPVIIDDFKKGYHIRTCWWAKPYLLKYIDQAEAPLAQFRKTDDKNLLNIVATIRKEDNPNVDREQKTLDNEKQGILWKQFTATDDYKSQSHRILGELKISEKDPDFAVALISKSKDFALKYALDYNTSSISLEEYLCWYVRHTKDCDFAVNLYRDKTQLCSVKLLDEAARVSGDASKYARFADDMLKNSKGNYGSLKKDMIIFLKTKNNLTDEDRGKILKWISDNFQYEDKEKNLKWNPESDSWVSRKELPIHPQNIPILMKMIRSAENPKEREIALYLLTARVDDVDWPDDFAAEYLEKQTLELLANKDVNARLKALKSLLYCKSPRFREKIVETLIKALQDPDSRVVQSSIDQLERRGTSIIPILADLINGKDPYVATKACSIIGGKSLFAKDAIPALAKAIESNPDWTIKAAALDAIGKIGPPAKENLPLIKKCLDDQNIKVRMAAGQALILLGGIKKDDPALEKIAVLELVAKIRFADFNKTFQMRVREGLE